MPMVAVAMVAMVAMMEVMIVPTGMLGKLV